MLPKPVHLGPQYGVQFQDERVVAAYHLRPPYPDPVYDVLVELTVDEPRAVLDVGAGTGEIARNLVDRVDRVDALDPSRAMIERGRHLPSGDDPNLRWILGAAEDGPISPPYALIAAGSSIHWMEWSVVLPRFRDALTPRGVLAIVGQSNLSVPWQNDLQAIIDRLTTNRDYRPYNIIAELENRNLFRQIGRHQTPPLPFRQTVADYVESFHSRNGLSRDRMGADAIVFDRDLTAAVTRHTDDGTVTLRIVGEVIWGQPSPD